jgi:hypothetical protein
LCTHVVVSRLLPIIIILLLLLLLLSSSLCVVVVVAVGDDDIVDDNGEDGNGDGGGGGDDDVFEVNSIGSIGGVAVAAAAEDVTEHVTEVEIGGVNLLENPCLTFKRRRCTGRDEVDVDIIIVTVYIRRISLF